MAAVLAAGTAGAAAAAPVAKPKKAEQSWRSVKGPSPRKVGALNQIELADKGYGWAAGVEGPDNMLALWKWNGRKWKRAKSRWAFAPAGLAVAGRKQAWVTGVTLTEAHALHYDGRSWRKVAFPGPGAPVDLAAAPDGTAVSVAQNVLDGTMTVQWWKGGRWRPLDVPLPPETTLTSVSVWSKKEIWLGGGVRVGDGKYRALLLRWNGKKWKRIFANGVGRRTVTKIVVDGPGKAWALRGSTGTTLLRWDGKRLRERGVPGGGALTLTRDGAGGVWVLPYSSSNAKAAPYLRWSKGRWTSFWGRGHGGVVGLGDIAWMPGTPHAVSVGAVQEQGPKERKFPVMEVYR